jgi:hypothetical protein
MVLVASSSDSADSYNGDDAQRFRREWNAAIDHYSKATKQNGQLEFALEASQVAFSAAETEASTIQAQLAESDARVVDKFFVAFAFLMLLFCQSNGFLFFFVFSSDGATGSPPGCSG